MKKFNILIVTDFIKTVDLIGDNANRLFTYNLKKATSGRDAIFFMKKYKFDLVILDMDISKINGMNVLRWAKKTNNITDILAISAWDSLEVAREVINEGAVDYITKPFELGILNLKIKNILTSKRDRKINMQRI